MLIALFHYSARPDDVNAFPRSSVICLSVSLVCLQQRIVVYFNIKSSSFSSRFLSPEILIIPPHSYRMNCLARTFALPLTSKAPIASTLSRRTMATILEQRIKLLHQYSACDVCPPCSLYRNTGTPYQFILLHAGLRRTPEASKVPARNPSSSRPSCGFQCVKMSLQSLLATTHRGLTPPK